MPALSKFYGLKPWDVDLMTLREINEYLAQYDRYVTENGG